MVNRLDMKKEVAAFVGIVFLLLGVLFGMQIMTFIFGNLESTPTGLPAVTNAVVNESGFINSSGYTFVTNVIAGFANPSIATATNTTDGIAIASDNFTLSTRGIVTNATPRLWNAVQFTYTYNADSSAQITSDAVVNNSLGAIATYTNQSDTQFNTAAIAITLLILIAIFAIFWKIFMTKGGISGGGGENRNFS